MRYLVIFLFIFCKISSPSLGQDHLTVTNSQNDEPLAGANIKNLSSGQVYTTDTLGRVEADLPTGNYEISYVGFTSKHVFISDQSRSGIISLEPNYQVLEAIEVRGFDNYKNYLAVAGGYSLVNSRLIEQFNQESLVRAVNTTPGVRMEERSPASYRLSIRGSLLRAPFGVRNVKVYWNDLPYTDPTGNAYLYFLDNANVDNIEIIKGPSGSIYGAGMGGVMILNSGKVEKEGIQGNIGMSFGSYGFKKLNLGVDFATSNNQSTFQYTGQKADGYREHTEHQRNVFQFKNVINYSEKGKLSLHMLYTDLFYQLPGGLTLDQYNENPRQARLGSVDQNAFVDHNNILTGINNVYFWNDRTGNSTSVYFNNGVKENPFITNYEIERLSGIGGRTTFFRNGNLFTNQLSLTGGMEIQYGKFHANNHDNDGGYAGDLRFEDESRIYQGFIFAQGEYQSKTNFILTAGASYNYLKYRIERLRDVAADSSYSFTREFSPVFSPRVGIVKMINQSYSVHASISRGFSPPTQEEIRTSDGSVNTDLEAEKGTNYELGIRGNAFQNKLLFDITAFYMEQNQTIVSRIEAGGNSSFQNAGKTSQKGLESLVAYTFFDRPGQWLNKLRLQLSHTLHLFRFSDYTKSSGDENVDYSGNDLTGTAPNILVANLEMRTQPGLYLFFNYNFTDKIPLNDANTVYSGSYQLVHLKLGWQKTKKTNWDIFVGVDNLLDEKYSLGNDLNAFGDRFYEPSPDRNYYAGINVSF